MKKTAAAIQLFLMSALVSGVALASEAGAEHEVAKIDGQFLTIVADFVLLVLLMYFLLTKQARDFFASRSLKIKLFMGDSKKIYNDAHKHFSEIESKLNGVEAEGDALIRSVADQSEQERKRLIVEARTMSQKIKEDARRIADVEVAKARVDLRSEATNLAMQLAEKKIKAQLTSDDQVRLGLDFVSQVKKAVQS